MDNLNLVSILIPSYNTENYIKETILSCTNQTYKNIEIIVVDDGSSDNSFEILTQLSKEYKNLYIYQQENKGAPAARNLAFEKSKGEYIQYLDADDILDKTKIESQLNHLEKNQEAVVFGKCKLFYNHIENSFEYNTKVQKNYEEPNDFLIDLWSNATSIYPHAYLVPRNLVEKVNGWDEHILKNQDGVFFAKVINASKRVIFDENSLVFYRLDNPNSISRKKSSKSEMSALKSYEEYEKLFKNDLNSPKVKYALSVVYSYFIFRNYPENKDLCKNAQEKIESFEYKKPINVNNKLYRVLEPLIGIYSAIWFHKFSSKLKQKLIRK